MTRKKNDEDEKTAHRVVEVSWLPRSSLQWATFTAARRACGDLWSAMVAIHKRIRRLNWKWPSRSRWEKWAKGKFPGLSAQSVQQTAAEFCECLAATTAARKAQKARGEEVTAEYPWKAQRYRSPTYTNQDAKVTDGFLRLSHGRGRAPLRIRLPGELPGRLMEVSLGFGVVRIACEVPLTRVDKNVPPSVTTGNDIGVNTLIAATDGETAILVSEVFGRSRVFVAPRTLGTGFATKNVLALQHGLPVVTSKEGFEGFQKIESTAPEDACPVVVAESAQEFAERVVELHENPLAWFHRAANAKKYVRETLTVDATLPAVRALCERLTSARAAPK
jgi:hypothetical protein